MEPTRLFDFIYYQKENYPLEKSFGKRKNGEWVYFSTEEMIEKVNQVSLGLKKKLGVKPDEKIALIVHQNCPEWVMMDLGMQQIGAINIPVYATLSPREYEYIFNEAEVTYAFCSNVDIVGRVLDAQKNIPTLKKVFVFDEALANEQVPFWETILGEGDLSEVEKWKAEIKPEDLATIIYTSGTTGNPKGVMLTHNNIISDIMAVKHLVPIDAGDTVLSFLPICHSFERTVTYTYIYCGFSVVHTGTDNLGGETGDLRAVSPHFFTTVPRLLEKVYEKIYNKGLELKGIKRFLFFWALRLTKDYQIHQEHSGWEAMKRKIADKLIFSKWREALGGRMKGILTGASACPEHIQRTFSAAGIPIREGYGLTETSPALTICHFFGDGALLGTVGPAIPCVELMLDTSDGNYKEGEGEILARGPNIMVGYYKQPDATAAVMKEIDGKTWFCTGDIGRFVEARGHKFLKITDRKKELLKTSGGKYVAPQAIENKFKENFYIEQMMVVGENKKFVSALIVPAVEALKDWCARHDVEFTSLEETLKTPQVQGLYERAMEKFNPIFAHHEQIKKFKLIPDVWEPIKADGTESELTPTMKLKRRVIMNKYARQIDEIYAD